MSRVRGYTLLDVWYMYKRSTNVHKIICISLICYKGIPMYKYYLDNNKNEKKKKSCTSIGGLVYSKEIDSCRRRP